MCSWSQVRTCPPSMGRHRAARTSLPDPSAHLAGMARRSSRTSKPTADERSTPQTSARDQHEYPERRSHQPFDLRLQVGEGSLDPFVASGVPVALRRAARPTGRRGRSGGSPTRLHGPRDGHREATRPATDAGSLGEPGKLPTRASDRRWRRPSGHRAGRASHTTNGRYGSVHTGRCSPAQYKARTGSVAVSRTHVEVLPDGAEVKLSVLLPNTKTRRAKLSADKLLALAALGLRGPPDITRAARRKPASVHDTSPRRRVGSGRRPAQHPKRPTAVNTPHTRPHLSSSSRA